MAWVDEGSRPPDLRFVATAVDCADDGLDEVDLGVVIDQGRAPVFLDHQGEGLICWEGHNHERRVKHGCHGGKKKAPVTKLEPRGCIRSIDRGSDVNRFVGGNLDVQAADGVVVDRVQPVHVLLCLLHRTAERDVYKVYGDGLDVGVRRSPLLVEDIIRPVGTDGPLEEGYLVWRRRVQDDLRIAVPAERDLESTGHEQECGSFHQGFRQAYLTDEDGWLYWQHDVPKLPVADR